MFNVGGMVMAGVLSGMHRKDTPPPHYQDPPSYHLALQIEVPVLYIIYDDDDDVSPITECQNKQSQYLMLVVWLEYYQI